MTAALTTDHLKDIAPKGFNRIWIAVAALCVHLSIGQIYAFSVFNKPLSMLLGVNSSVAGDWNIDMVGWVFTIAIGVVGAAVAFSGKIVERMGPRLTLLLAALFFGAGFFIGALGVYLHNFWVLCLGYGLVGGIGIGLGYISPVAVLMRWFPDKPGLAAGIAIMGFGGGAMIGAPMAVQLMEFFATPTAVGVWQTLLVMGGVYLSAMFVGSRLIHNPSDVWLAEHAASPKKKTSKPVFTPRDIDLKEAARGKNIYLMWLALVLNVTAGLGVISQASSMLQELFPVDAAMGALFVTLLSVGNMTGRLGWSTLSDLIGRKSTFATFFVLGASLYVAIPVLGVSSMWLYMLFNVIIISMYGGSFSAMPPYIKECFGMKHMGAIYGWVLTAWSTAAVFGKMLVGYVHETQLAMGLSQTEIFENTMFIMAGLLAAGFVVNLFVMPQRPVIEFKEDDEPEIVQP